VINARDEYPSEEYLLFVRVTDGDSRKDELLEKL